MSNSSLSLISQFEEVDFGRLEMKNAWKTAVMIYQSYCGQKDWKLVEISLILLIHHLVG